MNTLRLEQKVRGPKINSWAGWILAALLCSALACSITSGEKGGEPVPQATVSAPTAGARDAEPDLAATVEAPVRATVAAGAAPLASASPAPTAVETARQVVPGNIAQVWANEGGDKVTRDELRAANDPASVYNSVWDGAAVSLFGARNEVVAFNLVLEAPTAEATDIVVGLESLSGPDGASITTRPASGEEIFDYVGRNIELFYVRYLEIRGLSVDLAYEAYDERHIPERCRRPYNPETGEGSGGWEDRPCHNKFYPDIAVPLEFHTPFNIPAGANQSIWVDIYIPKTALPGVYTGMIEIAESGAASWQVPIHLQVRISVGPSIPMTGKQRGRSLRRSSKSVRPDERIERLKRPGVGKRFASSIPGAESLWGRSDSTRRPHRWVVHRFPGQTW